MKFTKEEISLCKQIAEKYRKEIKYGDWYEFKGKIYLQAFKSEPKMSSTAVPLWTISDCLEFLRERGYSLNQHFEDDGFFHVALCDAGKEVKGRGDTDLEACLKAVLAVLEESE